MLYQGGKILELKMSRFIVCFELIICQRAHLGLETLDIRTGKCTVIPPGHYSKQNEVSFAPDLGISLLVDRNSSGGITWIPVIFGANALYPCLMISPFALSCSV